MPSAGSSLLAHEHCQLGRGPDLFSENFWALGGPPFLQSIQGHEEGGQASQRVWVLKVEQEFSKHKLTAFAGDPIRG